MVDQSDALPVFRFWLRLVATGTRHHRNLIGCGYLSADHGCWHIVLFINRTLNNRHRNGSCRYTSEALGGRDHQAIVVDEIAGFLVACIGLPSSWVYLILAFALFRLFDIAKPWPIDFIDQRIKGGVGIIADDLMAGLYTLFCIQLLAFMMSIANTYLAT